MIKVTQIVPREYYDDLDNEYRIRRTVKKDKYSKPFDYMYHHFFSKGQNWVSHNIVRTDMCIVDRQEVYDVLNAFCVLNLLKKQKRQKFNYYIMINEHWWHKFHKEISDGD